MSRRIFIDAGEIANMLGLASRASFLRRRRNLERDHGFPVPMPHSAQPLLWRRNQVEAWIEEHGLRAQDRYMAPSEAVATGNVILLKEAARA